MGIITKGIFKSLLLCLVVWLETALEKAEVESVLMICTDENIQQLYSIIADISINYKEQMVITNIKSGIQYSIF